jgi:hypothetical protein
MSQIKGIIKKINIIKAFIAEIALVKPINQWIIII